MDILDIKNMFESNIKTIHSDIAFYVFRIKPGPEDYKQWRLLARQWPIKKGESYDKMTHFIRGNLLSSSKFDRNFLIV